MQTNPNQGLLQRLPGLGLPNNNAYPIDMNHPDTGKFGSSKKPIVFPEPKQTVDRGSDPITEDWLMSQNYYAMENNSSPFVSSNKKRNEPRNYDSQQRNMMRNEPQSYTAMEMNRNNYQMQMNMMNRYGQNPYENEPRFSHRSQRQYEEYDTHNPLYTEMENSQRLENSQRMENSEEYDHREYQSSAYSSNKKYNEPAPVIENRYEEPKLSHEDFRNYNTNNTRPTETRLEDDGRRLLKDITNDNRNYPETRNERVQQQDNYESVDLKAKQESSHKSSAAKENEPVMSSKEKELPITKSFAEDQPEKPVNPPSYYKFF